MMHLCLYYSLHASHMHKQDSWTKSEMGTIQEWHYSLEKKFLEAKQKQNSKCTVTYFQSKKPSKENEQDIRGT